MARKDLQPEKLGDILEKSLKRLDPSGRMAEYGVWPAWNETVGHIIARNAQPERIRHGTLFVKVSSSTWMQQLQYMKEMIAQKLNQQLGKEVVRNIFFVVGKVEAKETDRRPKEQAVPGRTPAESRLEIMELNTIGDPEIRQALRRLLAAHNKKRKR